MIIIVAYTGHNTTCPTMLVVRFEKVITQVVTYGIIFHIFTLYLGPNHYFEHNRQKIGNIPIILSLIF